MNPEQDHTDIENMKLENGGASKFIDMRQTLLDIHNEMWNTAHTRCDVEFKQNILTIYNFR